MNYFTKLKQYFCKHDFLHIEGGWKNYKKCCKCGKLRKKRRPNRKSKTPVLTYNLYSDD